MQPGNINRDGWHKARTMAAKRLAEFIRTRPDGVVYADITKAGFTTWGLDRLVSLGVVTQTQVREPDRGPRAYHWLWKTTSADTARKG